MSTVKADNFTWKSGEAGGQPQYTVSADKVIYGVCKVWINFNGLSGSVGARGSFNVSSLTRNGTGEYTVTYTNALLDSSTSVSGSHVGSSNSYQNVGNIGPAGSGTYYPTSTYCRFSFQYSYASYGYYDQDVLHLQVFR